MCVQHKALGFIFLIKGPWIYADAVQINWKERITCIAGFILFYIHIY
jgi:hypothetical protein